MRSMGQRRVVFWDFDGTLAEREGYWSSILREAVLAVDPAARVTVEELEPGLKDGFPRWEPGGLRVYPDAATWWAASSPVLVQACVGAGVQRVMALRAVAGIPQIYYRPGSWQIIAGASEALSMTATAGFANVILSNHAPELPDLVEALGFGRLVERTITSASLGLEKPNPLAFRMALRLTNASPDSWMIGDNPTADIAGARAIGMHALLVLRSEAGRPPLTLTEAAAHVINGPSA
ncbi:HAD family hydrolase [Nakamurella silvestris]|nr:HAD family hydrolase [Nakamurella silvestris]